METETELGNELGAVKYVSEISGWSVKDVANWFILLIIFVFDPLAIVLVIATNNAFNNLKPVMNIYGEPKPESKIWEIVNKLKQEGKLETATEPEDEPSALANSQYRNKYPVENERQRILQEIQKVESSNAIGRRKAPILEQLKNKLSSLSDDNTKTY